MSKRKFTPGKYTWLAIILLLAVVADVFTHKGITRALLPATFTSNRKSIAITGCQQSLTIAGKKWVKAVNTVERIKAINRNVPGIEMDVYFDTSQNQLLVYHDSAVYSSTNIEQLLKIYREQKLTASLWLDFKNLSADNQQSSLQYISLLQNEYQLRNKILIESSQPALLQAFCQNGFFTSYYVPFFNPYLTNENEIVKCIDTITANLQQYPTSALSGYYFQYPLLRKFFPAMPVLLWADKPGFSIVANIFSQKLSGDDSVKIILYPANQ